MNKAVVLIFAVSLLGGCRDEGESSAEASRPAVIRNVGADARWIVVDGQSAPTEFSIGQPAIQINGYGRSWCGRDPSLHNDPTVRAVRLGAGQELSFRLLSVTVAGDCYREEAVTAGSYPTKACTYDRDPGPSLHPGVRSPGIVCVDATLVVPADDGRAVVEL